MECTRGFTRFLGSPPVRVLQFQLRGRVNELAPDDPAVVPRCHRFSHDWYLMNRAVPVLPRARPLSCHVRVVWCWDKLLSAAAFLLPRRYTSSS